MNDFVVNGCQLLDTITYVLFFSVNGLLLSDFFAPKQENIYFMNILCFVFDNQIQIYINQNLLQRCYGQFPSLVLSKPSQHHSLIYSLISSLTFIIRTPNRFFPVPSLPLPQYRSVACSQIISLSPVYINFLLNSSFPLNLLMSPSNITYYFTSSQSDRNGNSRLRPISIAYFGLSVAIIRQFWDLSVSLWDWKQCSFVLQIVDEGGTVKGAGWKLLRNENGPYFVNLIGQDSYICSNYNYIIGGQYIQLRQQLFQIELPYIIQMIGDRLIQADRIASEQKPQDPILQESTHKQLRKIEADIQEELRTFINLHEKAQNRNNIRTVSQHNILPAFIRLISHSFQALQFILQFITDSDVMAVAATCRSSYVSINQQERLLYSPLGYKLTSHLRPPIIIIQKKEQDQQFQKSILQNLCAHRTLESMDQDYKIAIMLTMRTNLEAARQKTVELKQYAIIYRQRSEKMKVDISRISKDNYERRKSIDSLREEMEKLEELLKESCDHIIRLKEEQQKILFQRENKAVIMKMELGKLERQKELLIRKIKCQQKQKQDSSVYAKEVTRILALLSKVTAKKNPVK